MCTHQCLDCFLSYLKRHPNILPAQYKKLKRILVFWMIGHHNSIKIEYNKEISLSHFELYILYMFASKSVNCQDLVF